MSWKLMPLGSLLAVLVLSGCTTPSSDNEVTQDAGHRRKSGIQGIGRGLLPAQQTAQWAGSARQTAPGSLGAGRTTAEQNYHQRGECAVVRK